MRETEYRRLIRDMDRPALRALWHEHIVQDNPPTGWAKGKAFEYLVVRAFELDLPTPAVEYPFEVRDRDLAASADVRNPVLEQLDGSLEWAGVHWILESKNVKDGVDAVPILELRQRLERRPSAVMGMVFSARNGFTEPAIRLLRMFSPLRILLWDSHDIERALDADGGMVQILREKWQRAIWYAEPVSPPRTELEEAES